jgi:UDP-N-acetylmuramoyl-L-alanyl-D-glutamate--2,6-diaminopimelate ligase
MILKELLKNIDYELVQGIDTIEVENLSWDSRRVKANSLFICVKNKNVDRHDYAISAVEKGATALVIEHDITNIPNHITIIKVGNSKAAMAIIASSYYKEPSRQFNLIGITGTNGKTSTSYFISKILESVKRRVGVIGTIGNCIGDKTLQTEKLNPTTPDSIELQASFSEMASEGVTDVVMEVTSTALAGFRVEGCEFEIGVFTNLTQDHLDEHGTMENYKKAKMRLFKLCRYGVLNADDPVSLEIKKDSSCMVLTYGINNIADFNAYDIQYSADGVSFTLDFHGIKNNVILNVPGKFSVYNALAAITTCYYLGLGLKEVIEGVNNIKAVKGRFESVPNDKGIMVIVDYAHTPDGLQNILASIREIAVNKVVTVFGCGGDRDKTKRPIMGQIAGSLSDYCIITSDNPRTEKPLEILKEIEVGIKKTSCYYEKIENRRDAINAALKFADKGDIVVIAGKGHENYQIIGEDVFHFDDVEVVKELLSI